MKKLITLLWISTLTLVVALLVVFGKVDKSVEELSKIYAPPPSQFISVNDMDVHFRDEGVQSDSLPILLIHGTSSSLHTFDAWTEGLVNERRVIRMDLPGFGLTGPFPHSNYSIDRYVEFVYAFMDSLHIDQCVIAGNSLGGNIAWQFTATYPDRVRKLLLIDASGYPKQSKSIPIAFRVAQIPILSQLLTFITPKFMVESSVKNVYHKKEKVNDTLVDRYFDLTLREGNRQALVDRMNSFNDSHALNLIPSIKQPTLILWGEYDELIPVESAYRFQEDLMNDTLVILKNSGHVPMEEDPEESLQIVKYFLSH